MTPGYYDLGLSTRTFEAPLFGDRSSTTFRLFGNQMFTNGLNLSAWLNAGFPQYRTLYGLEADRIPSGRRFLRINAGDLLLTSLQPPALPARVADTYPAEGLSVLLSGERSRWNVFGGRAKYSLRLPGRDTGRFTLFGAEHLSRIGKNHFGAGVTVVEDPVYGDPDRKADRDTILTGRYFRELSPWAHLFAEVLTSRDGSLGARVGTQYRFTAGDVTSSVYSFGNGFPFLYPLYRPGERGVEVRGAYRPSEFSMVYGQLSYVSEDRFLNRSDLRGNLGLGWSFGSNRPYIHLTYSRDEVVYEALTTGEQSFIADRFAVSVTQSSSVDYVGLNLEHVESRGGGELDRSQALLLYRRVLGYGSLLDGSFVAQRDERGDLGFTLESALERPLRGRYYYVLGLGGAYLERGVSETGEGVARVGVSRRLSGNGWYGRFEVRIPFSIGLERSNLNRRSLALDIGHRYGWKDIQSFRSLFVPMTSPAHYGSIEGTVLLEGVPQSGWTVLINGEPRAVTGSDGSFRVRGVPVGQVIVTLDIRQLDPRYSVVEGFSREVVVTPRGVSRVDFLMAPLSFFQGSLLSCVGPKTVPLGGARVTLRGRDFSRTVTTSNVGSFQFDEIPPGIYEFEIDPASVPAGITPEMLPKPRIDLTQDVLAYVVRINCPAN